MNNKVLKISILLTILVIIFVSIAIYIIMPKLSLEKNEININVFDDYKNISYDAKIFNKDAKDDVLIDGVVDTTHVGTYTLTYKLKNIFFTVEKKLKVNVVDNDSPEISLTGESEYNVCSLENFVEPGFSAIDNYDGDLTSKVEKEYLSEDNIEYKVKDSSNNESKVTRKLVVKDEISPEIALNGKETVYIVKGSKYEDKGANAEDNCDGNLTNNIVVSGDVDTSKVGTYEINYSIKDNSNNENSVTRKVVVQEEKVEKDANDNNKSGVIYLTFDDGPASSTVSILDTLKKHNIKATFFVTMAGSDDVLKREANEGHTVALHTATHNYKTIYSSVDAYFEDLNTVSDRVKNITGIEAKYIRFPGGSSNTISKFNNGIMTTLAHEVEARGYKYFDWNVDVNDAGTCAGKKDKSACVLKNFKKYVKPNRSNVVLLHDIKSYTASALEDMIKYGISKGFVFKAIDDNTPQCHHGINN